MPSHNRLPGGYTHDGNAQAAIGWGSSLVAVPCVAAFLSLFFTWDRERAGPVRDSGENLLDVAQLPLTL